MVIKYLDRVTKKLANILPGFQKTNYLSTPEPPVESLEGTQTGYGASVSAFPPPQNRFTELKSEDSLASSGKSEFSGAFDGLADVYKEWGEVIKICKWINTYPINNPIPSTNVVWEEIDQILGRASTENSKDKSISDTGSIHDTEPNYGPILLYHQAYIRD